MRVTQIRTSDDQMEDILTESVRVALQEVGAALDDGRLLRVQNQGIVAVDRLSTARPKRLENPYEGKGPSGSATRSRQGSAGRQGTAGRPRSACRSRSAGATPRISSARLGEAYQDQLATVENAYPTLRKFPDDDGMWLLARSAILSGLSREATFLVGVPFERGVQPKSWGYWSRSGHHSWIGPRHTNFGDGSICAFSPADGAWSEGGSLTSLLDLYSAWALRQLHLEVNGRWPGRQYALTGSDPRVQAFYRLREFKDSEFCGCGSETARYAECCKPNDMRDRFEELATTFIRLVPGGFSSRRPPDQVTDFIMGRSGVPRLSDVHLDLDKS